MSDYGMIIKNNSLQIQIDSLYKNYALNQTGVTDITDPGSPVPIQIDINDVSETPIFAYRPVTTYYCTYWGFKKVGGDYTHSLMYVEEGHSLTLNWQVFISGYVAALPTYGLVIRNPSNQIVFSSGDKYFKVKGVQSLNVPIATPTDATVIDADNNYFILTNPCFRVIPAGPPPAPRYCTMRGMLKINSTTIRVNEFQFATVGGGSGSFSWVDDCILIEVGS